MQSVKPSLKATEMEKVALSQLFLRFREMLLACGIIYTNSEKKGTVSSAFTDADDSSLTLKRCRESVGVINLSIMFPQLITHNKVPGLSGH